MFQVFLMVLFGLIAAGLIVLLDFEANKIRQSKFWVPVVIFGIELIAGFLLSLIGYGKLVKSWEGYHGHRVLQFIHYITIVIVSTIIPHGDFLLHLGYFHKGTNKIGIEEPFPDGFEIPKEPNGYQGYLYHTRGGHFYFLTFGYAKCCLILIRMSVMLLFFFLNGSSFALQEYSRFTPLIVACLCTYTLFNLLMTGKLLLENTSCSLSCGLADKCCPKSNKKAHESDSEEDEYEGII